ncbi:RHS repeat-associated core domain-containing protein [Pseudomonas putida]|nr:RHS repeat-associated core domain-containing protein [Pseudomonas putida]
MPGILRSYSPHGQHHDKTSHAILLGFNGEHYDLLTQSYALGMGYRSYSPALMRFLSPDSLSPFDAGGLNLYGYCAGDPINFTDPSGHLDPKLLKLAKSRLKPTAPLGSQKLKVPARDKPVYKHSEKMPEGQSSTAPASEHLQLSSPKRPQKTKAKVMADFAPYLQTQPHLAKFTKTDAPITHWSTGGSTTWKTLAAYVSK